jgi:excisionase family DNA binding protein
MNDTMIYTVQEVAKIIHTSPNYVYKLIEKGYLPAIKLGSVKVLKNTLEQFLIENQGKDFTNLDSISKLELFDIGDNQ